MRFLIVDDDGNKVRVVRTLIEDCGVEASAISVAEDAVSARRLLNERDFEVVFLDVLLPARRGRAPSGDVSADLLREMHEGGGLRCPGCVIGMTADLDARSRHWEEFGELASCILHVESGSDHWKEPLRRAVLARVDRRKAQRAYDYDLCVLTALRDPEFSAFVRCSGIRWTREELLFRGVWVRSGEMKIGDRTLQVACAHSTSMGMVAATSLAERMVGMFTPRYLLMTGFCGGIGKDLSLGDLVVAEKAWDWQSGKHVHEEFLSSVDQKDGCPDLIAAAKKVAQSQDSMRAIGASTVHVAPMVSGSAVVADVSIHQLLQQQHRKVAAVDMEAYGVYYAASLSSPEPSVLCIKGVADLADSAKSDGIQQQCSEASARFAVEVIKTLSEADAA